MSVQNWSEHVVLVNLPAEPQMADDLADVAYRVRHRHDCDVVIDCSHARGWLVQLLSLAGTQ